jgi:hypothetical protein
MEESNSSKIDGCSPGQVISGVLWKPRFYYMSNIISNAGWLTG